MRTEPADVGPDLTRPRYEFRGDNAALQTDQSPEVVISGPAGTGKSLACLWKLHAACAKTPNVRALILRKTRASLSESALVTFEQQILPPGSGISDGPGRANRRSYRYPNGSEIVVGGIDKPGRIMSTEYDHIYVQEAIELAESDWEHLTTRLRNTALSYRQLLADTNPDHPQHWIRRRAASGRLKLLDSRHEDNPALWDAARGEWTRFGVDYVAILDALTGARKDRLRYGRWTQAEGVVYEAYDAKLHVIDPFPIPAHWPRYWVVDFGFVNPFVAQWWAEDDDGRLFLYREIYRTARLVEDHARDMLDLAGVAGGDWSKAREPRPRIVLCDHDAEDRATLERHLRMGTTAAPKDRQSGVQAVAARLRKAGDGRPRLFQFRTALVQRDQALFDAHKPTCTAEEWEGYVWERGGGRKLGEDPVKLNDHGCLVAGTLVMTATGERPIETIRPGELVLTRDGFRRVLAAGCTNAAAQVKTVVFSDGRTLTGTGNHPVFVNATEFVSIDALRYNDSITDLSENLSWKSYRCRPRTRASSACDSIGSSTGAIRPARTEAIRSIIAAERVTQPRATAGSIGTFGLSTTGQFPTATKSTTKTKTRSTTPLRTWNAWRRWIIASAICRQANSAALSLTRKPRNTSSTKGLPPLLRGTDHPKALPGTNSMPRRGGFTGSQPSESVSIAANPFSVGTPAPPVIAPAVAEVTPACGAAPITRIARAPCAAGRSQSIVTASNAAVPMRAAAWRGALRLFDLADIATSNLRYTCARQNATVRCRVFTRIEHVQPCPVYNLTVEGTPEYYANGILVHNCDCTRYLCLWLENKGRLQYHPSDTPRKTLVDRMPPGTWGRELQ